MAEDQDVADDAVDQATADQPKAPRKKPAPKATDPEQLVADIERTREELAETLDAIADKVSPKRVAKRTTKKVADAVKDTAHDAAEAVKDTASTAKEKVTGAATAKAGSDWAPDPGHDAVTTPVARPDLSTGERREVTAPSTPAPAPVGVTSVPAPYPGTGVRVKPEYVAAGAAVGLVAWLLLLRKRNRK